jgi:dihydropteroate synthase
MEETFAKYINVNGELMDLSRPQVMGILNVTPDSFYADSRKQAEEDIVSRVHQIIEEGGRIIDIGAYSSRQDAEDVSPEEEMKRLKHGLQVIQREFPDAIVSVDTFRADVARMCVEEYGTAIINDISAGFKVLSSKDAKKVYTQTTAAVLRMKDCTMQTVNKVQEEAGDILADAKAINESRAAEAAQEVIEDTAEQPAEQTAQ